ncbi:MAG: hypothetical protein K1X94_12935 [Sandaracinaceae bacterium]|nr:hypothetical protein [Sandaracinaceae bacterium]
MLARSVLASALGWMAWLCVGCQAAVAPPEPDAAIIPRDANMDAPQLRYVPPIPGYCQRSDDCNDRLRCTEDDCAPSHLGAFEGLCVHVPLPMCVELPDAGPADTGPDAPRRARCDPGLRFSCAVPGGCHEEVGWVLVRDASGVLYEGCPRQGEIVLGSVPITRHTEVVVRFSNTEGPCPGGHRCDRAIFDVELVGAACGAHRVLGSANLDNAADGRDRGPFTFAVPESAISAACCR